MKAKIWSSAWVGSKKPSKQRSFTRFAPAHAKGSLLGSHLAKPLAEKLNMRSLRVRKGDTVKVMRGQYAGKSGKVNRIDVENMRVFIDGVEFPKRDGSKGLYPLHPSKIMITDLEGKDKRRLAEPRKMGTQ